MVEHFVSRRRILQGATAAAAALAIGNTALAAAAPSGGNPSPWTDFRSPRRTHPKTAIDTNVPIEMDDGVVIRVDVWHPAQENGEKAPGPFPVIVTSHCYGKSLLSAMADYTKYGYVVVVADVRGTGSSEGSFGILDDRESKDAYNIVEWAGTQEFSTGKVGADGFSYLGSSSAMTAATRPPHLVAANFGGAPTDLYRTFLTQGGNWSSSSALWFALELLGVAPLPFTLNSYGNQVALHNPVTDLDAVIKRLLSDGSSIPFRLREMLAIVDESNNWDNGFWQERGTDVSKIEVPTLVYSGWSDLFLRDTPRDFRALQLDRGEKLMVIGPWTHYSLPKHIGAQNDQPIDDLLIAWFDRWLKGVDNGVDRLDPVLLWENGTEKWTGHNAWTVEETAYQRLYLTGAKSATSHSINDGSLSTTPPERSGADTEVINPLSGVCSRQTVQYLGGLPVYLPIAFFAPSFPIYETPFIDELAPCFREDDRINEAGALTYTTSAQAEEVYLTGPITLTMRGSTTAADPSWVAHLADVAPDGTARPMTSGALVASRRQLDPARTRYARDGDVTEPFHWHTKDKALPVARTAAETYDIEFWPTSWTLRKGHRLRLTVTGAELPHLLPTTATTERLGTLTVHHDPAQPSFLHVPVQRSTFR